MALKHFTPFIFFLGFIIFKTQASFANNHEYTVSDQISLSEISIQLYGKPNLWKEIAQYNHLKRPNLIHIGQVLKLKHKATLSKAEGNAALLALWRNRFGLTAQADPVAEVELPASVVSSESNFKQGLSLYRQKNYKKAKPFFQLARESNPDSIAAWFYEINCLKAQHRFLAAVELAHQLILSHPELAPMPALSDSTLHQFSENGSK